MAKDKKGKDKKSGNPPDDALYTTNSYVDPKWIAESSVMRQVAEGPPPRERGKSSYPHKYKDFGNDFYAKGQLENQNRERETNPEWDGSSTSSLYEYPVMQHGPNYDFNSKPAQNPKEFRGITNQKGRYKGTVAHDGGSDNADRPGNGGGFHRLKPSTR